MNNNVNIEEIRYKCNKFFDRFIFLFNDSHNSLKSYMDDIIKKYERKINFNQNFLNKIGYAIKLGINFFAMHVLGINHYFLNFDSYKAEKIEKNDKTETFSYEDVFTEDSGCLIYSRIFEGSVKTLEKLKKIVLTDDKKLLKFYKNYMVEVACNNKPLFKTLFDLLKKMNISYDVSDNDLKIMYENSLYSKGNVWENEVRDIFYENISQKKSQRR